MTSVFNPSQGPSAEATLDRSFDDSLQTAIAALQSLMREREQALPAPPPFPEPDLEALAAQQAQTMAAPGEPGLVRSERQPLQPLQTSTRRNDDPDPQRAGLETKVVAQTAAVLEKAYGEQGAYQAQHYRVETVKPRQGPTRYSLYDNQGERILSFDRQGSDISIRDDQLSEAHKADFLAAAQTLDEQGLPDPAQASEVLGAMGPAQSRAEYQARVNQSAQRRQGQDAFATTSKPTPNQAHQQEQAKTPVTAHDLAEWRMASVTLGRSAAQIQQIEAHAQTAAQLAGASSFNLLYQQDKQAPLALQLDPQHQAVMERDLKQFRDLLQERGPGFVQNLYQLQNQASQPSLITDNALLASPAPQSSQSAPSQSARAPTRSSDRERE